MYQWLSDALAEEDSHVITANRRLSRTLDEEYARQRIAAGEGGWRRPVIVPASTWYTLLAERLTPRPDRPARLTGSHSRVLWERVLEEDIDEPMLNVGSLARQCLETWNRLHDWCVPLEDCVTEANGPDQRIFARAALRYREYLTSEAWIDDAVFRATLPGWLSEDGARVPRRVTLAGFDRITPRLRQLLTQFSEGGCVVNEIGHDAPSNVTVKRYPNTESELRAAGAWARRRLDAEPDARVAIVVNALQEQSDRAGRLLREGVTPGWQYASERAREAVNVSFGRRLADYPAIAIALTALRWLSQPLGSRDVALLLRSPLLSAGDLSQRARLELRLRDMPDRRWSRTLLLSALKPVAARTGGDDWLLAFAAVDELLAKRPRRQRPRAWAELFDTVLAALGWPGKRSRGSMDYQLENRFRELLGELGRLELIQADMTLGDAIGRLVALSRDTVFQPEAGDTRVDVLGPLEAAGQDFDALWIAGMTSADWPPPGRPSPLLSRDLQQRYDMPDASPDDTVNQAARLLDRLLGSSAEAVVSYPAVIGDAEQMPTALLGEATVEDGGGDPGFYATTLLGSRSYEFFDDPAPPVAKDERIAGGARTLDLQTRDPFAAFAVGRLGIRLLRPFRPGIGADVRGNLIHDALRALYSDLPTRGELAGWPADERAERARLATQAAFTPMFRHADDTLKQLLRLEEQRARMLIESVLRLDAGRDDFSLAAVEQRLDSRIGPLLLSLRADRVDRLADDSLVILDYKTSRTQTFQTGGVPNDLQLPVYALAVDAPVAGLGLFRVDSAVIEIDGVGPGLGQDTDWDSALGAWRETVLAAALRFADGDARVNVRQAARDARPLSLLSRYAESVRNV